MHFVHTTKSAMRAASKGATRMGIVIGVGLGVLIILIIEAVALFVITKILGD